jgi:hypothetical protein
MRESGPRRRLDTAPGRYCDPVRIAGGEAGAAAGPEGASRGTQESPRVHAELREGDPGVYDRRWSRRSSRGCFLEPPASS